MKKFLLPESGNFYKANLHCHTNLSDGYLSPEQVKEHYKSKGYSIVAYTDHDILIPHDELNDESFLALHGFEMEINEPKDASFNFIKTCHICFIGIEPDNITQPLWHREHYQFKNAVKHRHLVKFDESEPDYVRHYGHEGISDIMQKARAKGFFVTYNHPAWSKERYPDYIGYKGMHAMEMFNGGCIRSGYEDYNFAAYDDFLCSGNKIYCIGADDNHNMPNLKSRYDDSGWAFTVIKAESLDYRTITKALEEGNFYASEGPEIYDLWIEDDKIHIKTSPVDSICINYQHRASQRIMHEDCSPVTEAELVYRPDYGYFRITITDKNGKHACTNAYFPEK